jgi:hypothetical protein
LLTVAGKKAPLVQMPMHRYGLKVEFPSSHSSSFFLACFRSPPLTHNGVIDVDESEDGSEYSLIHFEVTDVISVAFLLRNISPLREGEESSAGEASISDMILHDSPAGRGERECCRAGLL